MIDTQAGVAEHDDLCAGISWVKLAQGRCADVAAAVGVAPDDGVAIAGVTAIPAIDKQLVTAAGGGAKDQLDDAVVVDVPGREAAANAATAGVAACFSAVPLDDGQVRGVGRRRGKGVGPDVPSSLDADGVGPVAQAIEVEGQGGVAEAVREVDGVDELVVDIDVEVAGVVDSEAVERETVAHESVPEGRPGVHVSVTDGVRIEDAVKGVAEVEAGAGLRVSQPGVDQPVGHRCVVVDVKEVEDHLAIANDRDVDRVAAWGEGELGFGDGFRAVEADRAGQHAVEIDLGRPTRAVLQEAEVGPTAGEGQAGAAAGLVGADHFVSAVAANQNGIGGVGDSDPAGWTLVPTVAIIGKCILLVADQPDRGWIAVGRLCGRCRYCVEGDDCPLAGDLKQVGAGAEAVKGERTHFCLTIPKVDRRLLDPVDEDPGVGIVKATGDRVELDRIPFERDPDRADLMVVADRWLAAPVGAAAGHWIA